MKNLGKRVVILLLMARTAIAGEAEMLEEAMAASFRAGKFEDAITAGVKLVELRKPLRKEKPAEYATTLGNLAEVYRSRGMLDKAEPLYLEAMALDKEALGENHPSYATDVNNLALLYAAQGADEKAEDHYLKALSIWRVILGKDHPDYAQGLNNLGALYKSMGELQKAEALYNESLAILEKSPGKTHPDYAKGVNNLAGLYMAMGEFERAEPLFLRAKDILKTALGEKHPQYGGTLNNLALFYASKGDFDRAEPLYKQAALLWKETLGDKHPQYGTCLNNLAQMYRLRGAFDKAEPLYRQALDVWGAILGKKHPDYAVGLNNLATLYRTLGDHEKAEPLYREALAILRETRGEDHPSYATGLNNLALMYSTQGHFEQAETLYKQASAILERAVGKSHPSYGESLNQLAMLYKGQESFAKAEPLYREALRIYQAALGEKHTDTARILNNLAGLHEASGEPEKAEELLKTAIAVWHESGDLFLESLGHQNLGIVNREMGRLPDAKAALEMGITQFEEVRAHLGDAEKRRTLQATHGEPYAQLAAAHLMSGEKGEAFEVLERGRARSFLELLATRAAGHGASREHSDKLRQVETQLSTVRNRGFELRLAAAAPIGGKRSAQRVLVQGQISALERRRLDLIDQIRRMDAELGSVLAVDAPALRDVQALLGPDVTLVEYWHPGELRYPGKVTKDELWIFVLTRNDLTLVTVPVAQVALEKDLGDYAELLAIETADTSPMDTLSKRLHDSLIRPIADKLTTPTMVVVPWGGMFKIPFGALSDGTQPMVETRNLVVIPSAGLYKYFTDRRKPDATRLIALGNPTVEDAALPGAEVEVTAIGELFAGRDVRIREQATETAIKQDFEALGKPKVIHFACHGVFERTAPQLTHLKLAPDDTNDGQLEVHELYGLDWEGVSLVTLSACSSAKGELGSGQDLVGMVRGMMFAGARCVVSSLWDVDDKATQELMLEFYRHYVAGKGAAESMRLAQQSLRKGRFSHPSFWAAFVTYGDWK